jgi:hypothetical protein
LWHSVSMRRTVRPPSVDICNVFIHLLQAGIACQTFNVSISPSQEAGSYLVNVILTDQLKYSTKRTYNMLIAATVINRVLHWLKQASV